MPYNNSRRTSTRSARGGGKARRHARPLHRLRQVRRLLLVRARQPPLSEVVQDLGDLGDEARRELGLHSGNNVKDVDK